MVLFSDQQLALGRIVARLNYTNPFGCERMELERQALGAEFEEEQHAYWAMMRGPGDSARGNVHRLTAHALQLVEQARHSLAAGAVATEDELAVYDDLVLYYLFYHFFAEWQKLHVGGDARDLVQLWERFSRDFDHWMSLPGVRLPSAGDKSHIFAMLYQVFRAFFHIFDCVVGHSGPAAELRSRIWQSIFTFDMRRFRRSLYRNLHEVTTLVTGPSGSGKELVAQAIGRSRYIPFSTKTRQFAVSSNDAYIAVNVSAFSSNLIESELFGHAKGAYTGAEGNRAGWLETCGHYGTILLDEIGEMDPMTQVKLLRVLQNRQYQRMGESKVRLFHGKLIAATNRDLRSEANRGIFREDLYYRLCADVITTPSLSAHLNDNPAVLTDLIYFLAKRIAPGEDQQLAQQVLEWIERHLPEQYTWPGNIRELEQCVRNIMIHYDYQPATEVVPIAVALDQESWIQQMVGVQLTADELLTHYAKLAYRRTGSYVQAAKLLGMDRRTVKARCGSDGCSQTME